MRKILIRNIKKYFPIFLKIPIFFNVIKDLNTFSNISNSQDSQNFDISRLLSTTNFYFISRIESQEFNNVNSIDNVIVRHLSS